MSWVENGGPVVFRTAYTGEHNHDQLVALLEKHPPAANGRAFDYGNLGYNIASLAMDANLDIGWKEELASAVWADNRLKACLNPTLHDDAEVRQQTR